MAGKLLRQASADRERKRLRRAGDADRDPALPDLPETSTWEAGQEGENASDSASGNASDSGQGSGAADGGRGGGVAGGSPTLPSARPARRRGRPRGPERVKLSVRIRTELDDQLSEAVERTDLSPQYIVEQALERHFRALGIKRR